MLARPDRRGSIGGTAGKASSGFPISFHGIVKVVGAVLDPRLTRHLTIPRFASQNAVGETGSHALARDRLPGWITQPVLATRMIRRMVNGVGDQLGFEYGGRGCERRGMRERAQSNWGVLTAGS